ncbi:MAG: hypothetical protein R2755_14460 [Acidimicrobiales bacterium]
MISAQDHQLGGEEEERQQPDHRGERVVGRAGVLDGALDVDRAAGLQHPPAHAGEDRAGQQLAPAEPGLGQQLERQQEHAHVEQQRHGQHAEAPDAGQVGQQAGDAAGRQRADQRQADHPQQQHRLDAPLGERGPADHRHVPHVVERVLGGIDHLEPAPQRHPDADHDGDHRAGDRPDRQLVTDDGDLVGGRLLQVLLQVGVALEHEAEDRGQRQQQREQREEREVRHQGGQVAGAVIAELAHHRQREGHRRPLPLPGVEPAQQRRGRATLGGRRQWHVGGLHHHQRCLPAIDVRPLRGVTAVAQGTDGHRGEGGERHEGGERAAVARLGRGALLRSRCASFGHGQRP